MSWLKNLLRAVPFVGDAFGAQIDQENAENAASTAYERQKDFYQHRHQWEVEDLKAAGLNPILSATNGSTPMPSIQQAVTPAGASSSQGSNSAKALELLINAKGKENDEKKAVADLKRAEADKQKADNDSARLDIERSNSASNIALNKARVDEIVQNIDNAKQSSKLIAEQIESEIVSRSNSSKLTEAQSQQAYAAAHQFVEMVKVQKELANSKQALESSATDLNKKQVEFYSKKASRLKDEFESQYLGTKMGEVLYKIGFGFKQLNPFAGGRVGPLHMRGD